MQKLLKSGGRRPARRRGAACTNLPGGLPPRQRPPAPAASSPHPRLHSSIAAHTLPNRTGSSLVMPLWAKLHFAQRACLRAERAPIFTRQGGGWEQWGSEGGRADTPAVRSATSPPRAFPSRAWERGAQLQRYTGCSLWPGTLRSLRGGSGGVAVTFQRLGTPRKGTAVTLRRFPAPSCGASVTLRNLATPTLQAPVMLRDQRRAPGLLPEYHGGCADPPGLAAQRRQVCGIGAGTP